MNQVLIVGGYGVVGRQAAALLAQRQPQLELLLGGRSPQAAEPLLADLPQAQAIRFDLNQADPLAGLPQLPDLVLVVANDQHDRLLRSALRHGVPLIDITRWTARVRDALAWAAAAPVSAPVILASSWMASIPAILAAGAARDFERLSRIDIDILYAMQDRAGPNSVEYMDRLALPFETIDGGRRVLSKPFSATRRIEFGVGQRFTTSLFDSPDQMSLPAITRAETVTTHIGFDHELSNRLLIGMIRSGLWQAISGPAFTGLRRKLLFNPGEGDHHRVRIQLAGYDGRDRPKTLVIHVDDTSGQTHLTAVGAVIQVERALGLGGHEAAAGGVQFAEAATDPERTRHTLADSGVLVTDESHVA